MCKTFYLFINILLLIGPPTECLYLGLLTPSQPGSRTGALLSDGPPPGQLCRPDNYVRPAVVLNLLGGVDIDKLPPCPRSPAIDGNYKNVKVRAGDKIVFDLDFTGYPKPVITFSKDKSLTPLLNSERIQANDMLTILSANRSQDKGIYTMSAKNSAGLASINFEVEVLDVPKAPVGPIKTSDIKYNSVTLSWKPPTDIGGTALLYYIIERQEEGRDEWVEAAKTVKISKIVGPLKTAVKYQFRVKAVNTIGASVPLMLEETVIPRGPPTKPLQARVINNVDKAVLTWMPPNSDNGSPIKQYLIESKELPNGDWIISGQTSDGQTLKTTISPLTVSKTYEFRVSARNGIGMSEPSKPTAPVVIKGQAFIDKTNVADIRVDKGKKAEIVHSFRGLPVPQVVWFFNGKAIDKRMTNIKVTIVGNQSILAIESAAKSLEGVYTLVAKNTGGLDKLANRLFVNTEPTAPIGPLDLVSIDDKQLLLSAKPPSSDGGKPIIEYIFERIDTKTNLWVLFGKVECKPPNDPNCPRITLNNIEANDIFRVKAVNGIGESVALEQVDIKARFDKSNARNITVDKGKAVRIELPFYGIPVPEITVKVNDNTIDGRDPNVKTLLEPKKIILTIDSALKSNEGVYKFRARNDMGLDEVSIQLKVTTEPDRPNPPLVFTPDSNQLILSAKPPASDGGSPITGYVFEVYNERTKLTQSSKVECKPPNDPNCAAITINSIDPKDIKVRVKALNRIGESLALDQTNANPLIDRTGVKDIVVDKGQEVVLKIPISGIPFPEVVWKLNGKPIEKSLPNVLTEIIGNKAILNITSADKPNEGTYTISASNSESKDEASIKVKVNAEPGQPNPPFEMTPKGESFELSVKPPASDGGKPITSYVFEKIEPKSGKWLPITKVECNPPNDPNCAKTTVKSVEPNDKFRVKAINSIGESEPLEQSNTGALIDKSNITSITVDEGDPVVLGLPFSGIPFPVVMWKLNETPIVGSDPNIKTSVNLNKAILNITSAVKSNEGTYSLRVENSKGFDEIPVKVWVNTKPTTPLPLETTKSTTPSALETTKPSTTLSPIISGIFNISNVKDVEANRGQAVSLEVPFIGEPPKEMKWKFNDKAIDGNDSNIKTSNDGNKAILNITSADKPNEGTYTLSGSNGQVSEEAKIKVKVNVEPNPPNPPFEMKPIGSQIELSAKPPASDGGKPITGYIFEKIDPKTNEWIPLAKVECNSPNDPNCAKTIITSIKPNDKFRVKALNSIGESQPLDQINTIPSIEKPIINDIIVDKGKELRLELPVTGIPFPDVVWKLNGKPINTTDPNIKSDIIGNKAILNIKSADKPNAGTYTLSATNSKGADEAPINVKVNGEPGQPNPPLEVNQNGDNVVLKVKPPASDGGKPINGYVFEKLDPKTNKWIPISKVECNPPNDPNCGKTTIKSVEPNDKFRVKAINSIGESEPLEQSNTGALIDRSNVKDITLDKGMPLKLELNFSGTPFPSVQWQFNANPISATDPQINTTVLLNKTILSIDSVNKSNEGLYALKVNNSEASDEVSIKVKINAEPPAPEGLDIAWNEAKNQYELVANAPKGDNNITGYIFERVDPQLENWNLFSNTTCQSPNDCTKTPIDMLGTNERFQVKAVNSFGASVPFKRTFDKDMFCPQPVGPITDKNKTSNAIHLVWSQPPNANQNPLTYTVQINALNEWKLVSNITDDNYWISSLKCNTGYLFRVRSVHPLCKSEPLFSEEIVTKRDRPSTVEALNVIDIQQNSVTVVWEPPLLICSSLKSLEYKIYSQKTVESPALTRRKRSVSEGWELLGTTPLTKFNANDLNNDYKYKFKVIALNDWEESDPKETEYISLPKPPANTITNVTICPDPTTVPTTESLTEVITTVPTTESLTEVITTVPTTESLTEVITTVPTTESLTEVITTVPTTESFTEVITSVPTTETVTEVKATVPTTEMITTVPITETFDIEDISTVLSSVVPTEIQPPIPTEIIPLIPTRIQPSFSKKMQPPILTEVQPPISTKIQSPFSTKIQPPIPTKIQSPIPTEVQPPIPTKIQPPILTEILPPSPTKIQPPIHTEIQPPIPTKIQLPILTRIQPLFSKKYQPPVLTKIQPPIPTRIQHPILIKILPPSPTEILPPSPTEILPFIPTTEISDNITPKPTPDEELNSSPDVVSALSPPSAPLGPMEMKAMETMNGLYLRIGWKPPLSDGKNKIIGYMTEKFNDISKNWFHMSNTSCFGSGVCTNSLIDMIEPNDRIRVFAVYSAGRSQPLEAKIDSKIFCPKKVNELLIRNKTSNSLQLFWTPIHKTFNIPLFYRLEKYDYRSKEWKFLNQTVANNYTINDLNCHSKQWFRINALNSECESSEVLSEEVTTDKARPTAPLGPIEITNVTNANSIISWKAPTLDCGSAIKTYAVEKQLLNSDVWRLVGNTPHTRVRVKHLKNAHKYRFRVKAINDFGESEPMPTNWLYTNDKQFECRRTLEGSLHIHQLTGDSMRLCWNDTKNRALNLSTVYIVEKHSSDVDIWQQIGQTVVNNFTVNGLLCESNYKFRVKEVNEFCETEYIVSKLITANNYSKPEPIVGPVVAYDNGVDEMNIHWNISKSTCGVIKSYSVEKQIQNTSDWHFIGNTVIPMIVVPNITPTQYYKFRIKAINSYGESESYITRSVAIKDSIPDTNPNCPKMIQGLVEPKNIGENTIRIEWKADNRTDKFYRVEKFNNKTLVWEPVVNTIDNYLIIDGLDCFSGKRYRISVSNGACDSEAIELEILSVATKIPEPIIGPIESSLDMIGFLVTLDDPDSSTGSTTGIWQSKSKEIKVFKPLSLLMKKAINEINNKKDPSKWKGIKLFKYLQQHTSAQQLTDESTSIKQINVEKSTTIIRKKLLTNLELGEKYSNIVENEQGAKQLANDNNFENKAVKKSLDAKQKTLKQLKKAIADQ